MKKVNIPFIKVGGQELLSKMYTDGQVEKESVIEDVYKMFTYKSSNMNIMTVKKGFYGTREMTDGYMTFEIDGQEVFYGIQEVKRKVRNNVTQMSKQLLQALRYLWLYKNDPSIKVIILNSEKFYTYVFVKEIKDLIDKLAPLFAKSDKSASKSWDDLDLKTTILSYNISFHIHDLDKKFELSKNLKDIYKNCA